MLEELGLARDPVLSPNSAGEGVQGERRSIGKAREGEGKKASESVQLTEFFGLMPRRVTEHPNPAGVLHRNMLDNSDFSHVL